MIAPAALVILALSLLGSDHTRAQLLEQAGGGVPVTVEAEQGIEWIRDAKMYVARGNAVATRGEVTVRADVLTALYREKGTTGTEIYRLEATGSTVIETPNDRALADRAVYDLDQGVVVLLGDALRFENGKDVITARDSLEYWDVRKLAVARGNAVVLRDGRRIRADVLTAYFEDVKGGGTQITRVDATGNVVITTAQEVARGREGVYNALEEKATLIGDVRITRGENQLNGQRAVVDLKTGVSRLLPSDGSGGRVKGLFTPRGTSP
ncbi:MAG: hypothetical protein HQ481_12310 [Alphaproteobacteria bacterium]|nr:hypothetical protein [Alphaproteobacteria bacterium]